MAEVGTHPLQYAWTLWTDGQQNKRVTQQTWEANVKKVAQFTTVEDFWGVFNNILEPSQLPAGTNYHLFRDPIMPKWEDPANEKGGKWVLTNSKSKMEALDGYWINTVLSIIGENYAEDENQDVCGVVVSIRRGQDRISIWTASASSEELQTRIGASWKEALMKTGLSESTRLEYIPHKDSMAKNSSYSSNAKYVI